MDLVDWTNADGLWNVKFGALSKEKKRRSVVKEEADEPRITSDLPVIRPRSKENALGGYCVQKRAGGYWVGQSYETAVSRRSFCTPSARWCLSSVAQAEWRR